MRSTLIRGRPANQHSLHCHLRAAAYITMHQHAAACSSAYSVDLQDILPPAGSFALLSGAPSAMFDRIAVGGTERHSYSVTPKVRADWIYLCRLQSVFILCP